MTATSKIGTPSPFKLLQAKDDGGKDSVLLLLYKTTLTYSDAAFQNYKVTLTHRGRVKQICLFTLQLCKTDEANLRF